MLKKLITYSLIILVCISCDNWLAVNENPNTPAEVDYQDLLASGMSSVAYIMGGRYQVLGALWSQHWTQSPGASQYKGLDNYDISSSTFDDEFSNLYSEALMNLEEVKQRSREDGELNYTLIATVMQVYTFQVLADLYDQIPFSEALKGEEGVKEPKWENGSDIYDSLIARLDTVLAFDLYAEDYEDPEDNDLLFGGEMDYWVQFANTLKLKIYLRQSEVYPAKAKKGIEKLYDDEVEFLEANVVLTGFEDATGLRNPLYATEMVALGNNPNLILSYTLHSFMEENDDERLSEMFNLPTSGSVHNSLAQGDYTNDEDGSNSAYYSKPLMDASMPVFLMSYIESLLLQSEAIIRYNVADFDDAKDCYEDAVAYAFYLYFGSDADDMAKNYLGGVYAFPSEGSDLEYFIEAIITQKWVSLVGLQSLETFFEHNRTGYPEISEYEADDDDYIPGTFTKAVNNITNGRFPKRLIFPESESSTNTNTPAEKDVWENVWWDVKDY